MDKIEKSYQLLTESLVHYKLIALHPHSQYRSLLTARLISDPGVNVIYYAITIDDISVSSFLKRFVHMMTSEFPTLGHHLNLLGSFSFEDEANVQAVIKAFLCEIDELPVDNLVVIFDEFDLCDHTDEIQLFFELVVPHLPDKIRFVINSRSLPRFPWSALAAQNSAIILDDEVRLTNLLSSSLAKQPEFEVFGFGPGQIFYQGEPIDTWEGHLPRLLLFFALDKPTVSRAEICRSFWPELDAEQVVNVFHVTKRRLHKALDRDILMHNDIYYAISPDIGIWYDVAEFAHCLQEGRILQGQERLKMFERAVRLYQSPFLHSQGEAWIMRRREAYLQGYLEAVTELAQDATMRGDSEQAIRLYSQALEEDFRRQDIHRQIMQLYHVLGRRSEAIAHFQELKRYSDEHNLRLDRQTMELYQILLA